MGFVDEDGRLGVDFLACLRNSLVERFVDTCAVEEHRALQTADIVEDGFVGKDVYVVEIQVVLCGRVDLGGIHEERTFVGLEDDVGDDDGVVLNVISADVE